jgi:serine/threonine-protein kinase HipA
VFEYGASFGGARANTAIEHDSVSYVTQFNRPDDLFNVAAVEHASMQMLSALPSCAAHTQVLATPIGDVLLVKRFDSEIWQPIAHYMSAHALIQIDKMRPSELNQQYSYGYLAKFSMQFSANALDPHDLYYRMVLNTLMCYP